MSVSVTCVYVPIVIGGLVGHYNSAMLYKVLLSS